MKKVISFLVVSLFIFQMGSIDAFAATNSQSKTKIISLFGFKQGNALIAQIANFVQSTIKKNPSLLYKLLQQIGEKDNALGKKGTSITKQESMIKALYDGILIEGHKQRAEAEVSVFSLDQIGTGITDSEKDSIKTKILSLQQTLTKSMVPEKLPVSDQGMEAKGKLEGDISLDEASLGKIFGKVQFDNFISEIKGLDSDTSGDLGIDYAVGDTSGSVKTNVHVIKKGGAEYVKYDALVQSGSLGGILGAQGSASLANIGKFIKISDASASADYQQMATNMQNVLPSFVQKIKENPLMIAYKKVGDSYVLIPSRDTCSVMKQIQSMGTGECSDSEYTYTVQEYLNSGVLIQLSTSGGNDIYSVSAASETAQTTGKIVMNGNSIESLSLDVTPDQTLYPQDGISIQYSGTTLTVATQVSGIAFGMKVQGTTKDYAGNFSISIPSYGLVKGTISGQSSDEKNGNMNITFDGSTTASGQDSTFSGSITLDVKNGTDITFRMNGKALTGGKEIFSGNLLYDIQTTLKDVNIQAPTDWVDINDLTGSTLTSTDTGALTDTGSSETGASLNDILK